MDVNKLINEKIKLYDLDDLMKSVNRIQRNVFKESIDFYIAEKNKLEGLPFGERGRMAATLVNRYEKRISDAIARNRNYQTEIRRYLKSFNQVDALNLKIHKSLNNIDISKIINVANKEQRELMGTTAAKIVSPERIKKALPSGLVGNGMRDQFTKPIKKTIYQNLMKGTPETQVKTVLHNFIVGRKDSIGQLNRWVGQLTRDALSQYDGAVNDMVRKEYDLNAFKYIGSEVKDSRPQCIRWIRNKNRILMYDELAKEIRWAYNNGKGMISGTNKDNFSTNRGGHNCRHDALPIRIAITEE